MLKQDNKWFVKQGLWLFIISVVIAVVSFYKEMLFAKYFGTSATADAYTVAIQLPEILFAVVWEAINAVVIPLYSDNYHKKGKESATKFLACLLAFFILGTLIILILGEIFSEQVIWLLSPGLKEDVKQLASQVLRWVLPVLLFEGIIRISNGILNVHGKFVFPKILSAVRNIGVIVALVLFANRFGVIVAAYGLLTGIIIECLLTVIKTSKNQRYKLSFNFKNESLITAAKMSGPIILGTGIGEINQIVDKIIASFLITGSITSLNYASKLSSIIYTLILGNIISLMYPSFANLAMQDKKEELSNIFTSTINATLLIGLPIAFGGVILKNELVTLFFARGAFDQASVVAVGVVFSFYLFSSVFDAIRICAIKLFTVYKNTKTPMINAAIGAVINIALNIVLAKLMGTAGLALATAISSAVIAIILLCQSKRFINVQYKKIIFVFIRALLSAVVMCVALIFIKKVLDLWVGVPLILTVVILLLIGILLYLAMTIILRISEVKSLIKIILKRNK